MSGERAFEESTLVAVSKNKARRGDPRTRKPKPKTCAFVVIIVGVPEINYENIHEELSEWVLCVMKIYVGYPES